MGLNPGNFLDEIAIAIRDCSPNSVVPDGNTDQLFRIYALLAMSLGSRTSERDVHNAWCVWMLDQEPLHESIRPFEELGDQVVKADLPFTEAIRKVVREHLEP